MKEKVKELEQAFESMMGALDRAEKAPTQVPEEHRFATEILTRVAAHQAMIHYMDKHREVFGAEESDNG